MGNIASSENTACVWELFDRNYGYKIFNGNQIKVRLNTLSNMDIYLAYGDTLATSTLMKNTSTFKVGEWISFDVVNTVFIAAVPKPQTAFNSINLTVKVEPWVNQRNKLDLDSAKLLSLI